MVAGWDKDGYSRVVWLCTQTTVRNAADSEGISDSRPSRCYRSALSDRIPVNNMAHQRMLTFSVSIAMKISDPGGAWSGVGLIAVSMTALHVFKQTCEPRVYGYPLFLT
jgi:hypothetical protein